MGRGKPRVPASGVPYVARMSTSSWHAQVVREGFVSEQLKRAALAKAERVQEEVCAVRTVMCEGVAAATRRQRAAAAGAAAILERARAAFPQNPYLQLRASSLIARIQ